MNPQNSFTSKGLQNVHSTAAYTELYTPPWTIERVTYPEFCSGDKGGARGRKDTWTHWRPYVIFSNIASNDRTRYSCLGRDTNGNAAASRTPHNLTQRQHITREVTSHRWISVFFFKQQVSELKRCGELGKQTSLTRITFPSGISRSDQTDTVSPRLPPTALTKVMSESPKNCRIRDINKSKGRQRPCSAWRLLTLEQSSCPCPPYGRRVQVSSRCSCS